MPCPIFEAKDTRRGFTDTQRQIIWRQANGQCEWINEQGQCGVHLSYYEFEADHIVQHSEGGQTTIENGRVLCEYRNRANGRGMLVCPLKQQLKR